MALSTFQWRRQRANHCRRVRVGRSREETNTRVSPLETPVFNGGRMGKAELRRGDTFHPALFRSIGQKILQLLTKNILRTHTGVPCPHHTTTDLIGHPRRLSRLPPTPRLAPYPGKRFCPRWHSEQAHMAENHDQRAIRAFTSRNFPS